MQAEETQEGEESVEAQLIKGAFSSLTLYRWEKIKGSMPKFERPTNVMFIQGKNYIGVSVPDRLYYCTGRNKEEFLKIIEENRIGGSTGGGEKYVRDLPAGDKPTSDMPKNLDGISTLDKDNYISADSSDHFVLNDRAVNFSNKDSMIKTERDVFYTNDNRNTPYLKYTNVYKDGEYDFFFTRDYYDPNAKKYYVSEGVHSVKAHDAGRFDSAFFFCLFMNITHEKDSYSDIRISGSGNSFRIFGPWKDLDRINPVDVYLSNSGYYSYFKRYESTYSGERFDDANYKFSAYQAEELNFSKLNNDTTIGDGQVLSISSTGYIDANGIETPTKGCFIGNGQTVTINKGGVLSISGNLINNGTIINNGGVILIKDGGSISSFLAGNDIGKNGCGSIKCANGDILIEKGGALYAGMNDSDCNIVPFYLDNSSTFINCGLLCYGSLRLGHGARVECRSGSRTIGNCFGAKKARGETMIEGTKTNPSSYAHDDRYRIVESTTAGDVFKYYVYLKPSLSENDNDYDIYSYYTDRIMKTSSGIPSGCKGLYRQESVGGMYQSGSTNSTVLQFSGAKIEDKAATDNGLITQKDGL